VSKFIVVNEKIKIESPKDFLFYNSYYKSYSLYLAYINDISILDTLILTSPDSIEVLEEYINCFPYPMMLRMDYANLANSKYIGGIPIYSLSTLKKICLFLFENGYIPVLQPYANRFENLYSFSCSLSKKDNEEFNIEFVGKGFDAGDLRLGLITPHEEIEYDCTNWKILSRKIRFDEYLNSKLKRELYMGKMETYIKYVNSENKLLKDINILKEENNKKLNDEYIPATKWVIEEAAFLLYIIKLKIIPALPPSQDYVVSFSMLEDKKYVLWDIYGTWYIR
jgi:hypothetical protein